MPLIGRVGAHRGFEEQIWQNWADLLLTEVLPCGHFLPEEQPDHVAAAIHNLDEQVKAAGAFVLNGALAPAASEARLVRTALAGHALDDAVERRPFAKGERQIQAFYIMECDDINGATAWANKLPTYGYVEVRELLQY